MSIIPAEALKNHIGIVAKAGAGKTYAAKGIVEGLLDAGERVCIVDPTGVWNGLRSKANGKSGAYPVVIFGGEHADLPLGQVHGEAIAEIVATSNTPAIIDTSLMKVGERTRFFTDFASELLRKNRGPLHLFIDECHLFCLDTETELLTAVGWKKWDEIKVGDSAVCFDLASETYSHGAVERVIRKTFDGEMVQLKSDGVDCLATDDHRVVMRSAQRAAGRYKLYPWKFRSAGELPTQIMIPRGGAPFGRGISGLTTEMCRIIGWVATDGSIHDKRAKRQSIAIEQSHTTTKRGICIVAEMLRVLTQYVGATLYERQIRAIDAPNPAVMSAPSFRFYLDVDLSQQILQFLGSDIHRIPRSIITNASQEQTQALFDGLMEGDGTSRGKIWTSFYAGKNEGLADDFQEIAIRLGWSASKKFVRQNSQWIVALSRRPHHCIGKPSRQPYKGFVWDVTVPTGAFVARRHGKVFVTGNCPQGRVSDPQSGNMLHAANNLISLGRAKGLRVTLISQRPAKIHKDSLSQIETLIALRLIAPQDRHAIEDWIADQADEQKGKDIIASLPSLSTGQGWVWAPELGILKKVTFPKIKTFDSSSTPDGDGEGNGPVLAAIDMATISSKLVAIKEEADANDPAKLKARIGELEKQLATAPPPVADKLLEHARAEAYAHAVADCEAAFSARKATLASTVFQKISETEVEWPKANRKASLITVQVRQQPLPKSAAPAPPAGELPRAQQRVVDALGFWASVGNIMPSRAQVAAVSGYSVRSSGFEKTISQLSTAGIVSRPMSGALALVDPAKANRMDADAARGKLLSVLAPAQRRVLDAFNGTAATREEIAERSQYSNTSSGFEKTLSQLSSIGIVTRPAPGIVDLADWVRELL